MSEESASRENDTESFVNNSNECMEHTQASETGKHQPLLESLIGSSVLNIYDLDEKDLRIVTILFGRLLDGENEMRAGHLLKSLEKDKIAAFKEIKRIARLKEKGILETTSHFEDDGDRAGALLRSNLRLSSCIVDQICNVADEPPVIAEDTYKENLDYLSDQFERIRLVMEIKGIATERRMRNRSASDRKKHERELEKLECKIKEKLCRTDMSFPLELLKKKENLSHKEELILTALLRSEIFQDKHWEVEDLLTLISETPYEKIKDSNLFEKKARLIKDKFIEIASVSFPVEHRHVVLHKDIKAKLLEEDEEENGDFSDDFFEVIRPAVSLEKIILHYETLDQINLALSMIQGRIPHRLRSWGIGDKLQTKTDRKFRPSVNILFYGPPGTGKTITANAMACMLKRDLVTLDCSTILDRYVGGSEKNTRRIFDRYKEISKKIKRPPVLLLNEADQFLHRRIGATRSTDHMYNQMQNIFLEQIERFEGVLIATTNLLENLDAAFSRRFQHKIEFRRPGPIERLKLWQIHLPKSAPLADDLNIEYLADTYDLSGGQIAVVIKNAAARAAMRGDKISQEDFILACENEIAGSFDERAKRRIGFRE